jgi:hypothetical protein
MTQDQLESVAGLNGGIVAYLDAAELLDLLARKEIPNDLSREHILALTAVQIALGAAAISIRMKADNLKILLADAVQTRGTA